MKETGRSLTRTNVYIGLSESAGHHPSWSVVEDQHCESLVGHRTDNDLNDACFGAQTCTCLDAVRS